MKYYKMDHRGGLKEALETKTEITKEEFEQQLKNGYKYYAYDARIKCDRFIIANMKKNLDKPTWLLIEHEENPYWLK